MKTKYKLSCFVSIVVFSVWTILLLAFPLFFATWVAATVSVVLAVVSVIIVALLSESWTKRRYHDGIFKSTGPDIFASFTPIVVLVVALFAPFSVHYSHNSEHYDISVESEGAYTIITENINLDVDDGLHEDDFTEDGVDAWDQQIITIVVHNSLDLPVSCSATSEDGEVVSEDSGDGEATCIILPKVVE